MPSLPLPLRVRLTKYIFDLLFWLHLHSYYINDFNSTNFLYGYQVFICLAFFAIPLNPDIILQQAVSVDLSSHLCVLLDVRATID